VGSRGNGQMVVVEAVGLEFWSFRRWKVFYGWRL
jgi:hypothetical protein